MKNEMIRAEAKKKGVKLWEIAERLGIQDSQFSKKLRHELKEDDLTHVLNVIDEIADRTAGKGK